MASSDNHRRGNSVSDVQASLTDCALLCGPPVKTSVAPPPGPSKLSKSTTAAEANAEADEDEQEEEDEEDDDEIELDEEDEPSGSKGMTPRQKEKAAQRSVVAANKVGLRVRVWTATRPDSTCYSTSSGKATDDQEQSYWPEGCCQRKEGGLRSTMAVLAISRHLSTRRC